MPNTESAKRSLRKKEVRRLRNRSERSALRTIVKKVRVAVGAGDAVQSKDALQAAIKRIDRAADKGLIHKNKAARDKSRLTKACNKLAAAGAAAPAEN
ncbi:MAG TPA: 30S ribosomal protein S20 [Planctomycetaceae bacterium]|nr:30S ribosomal protein S20 [Planctomycetaceae bacterium]